jgi:hypothetical protein
MIGERQRLGSIRGWFLAGAGFALLIRALSHRPQPLASLMVFAGLGGILARQVWLGLRSGTTISILPIVIYRRLYGGSDFASRLTKPVSRASAPLEYWASIAVYLCCVLIFAAAVVTYSYPAQAMPLWRALFRR